MQGAIPHLSYLCAVIGLAVVGTSCTQSSEARAREIAGALDAPALQAWAAGVVQSVGKDYMIPIDSPVYKDLPPAVRAIPHSGMIGPTAITTKDGRVELMWIDSWGHGFVLAISGPLPEHQPSSHERRLAPGISFWPVGIGAR
jgi:hypothetical protein